MISFCYDKLAQPDIGYPNLAQHQARPYTSGWREFDHHWPRTTPLRLLMYLRQASIPFKVVPTNSNLVAGSWYPIALAWFDFSLDYFELLTPTVCQLLSNNVVKILFYYHEGDNPVRIKHRLDDLCKQHQLPNDCYFFVSANTAASKLKNFAYFSEHEFFFRYVNRYQQAKFGGTRSKIFTALNRTHKWWRASCMSDLYFSGLLENSMWSYNTDCTINDNEADNPLELDSVDGWRDNVHNFINQGPYACDNYTSVMHNDHHDVNVDLYQSYCHIVLETHFDADQSQGTFITEKTWKVIKYGQPFVIVGPAGSLQTLRDAGYRVFDHVIDNSYDSIVDNTQRWIAVKKTLTTIQNSDLPHWFDACQSDIRHNQQLFDSRLFLPLNILLGQINEQHS